MARASQVADLRCEGEAEDGARLVLLTRVGELIDFREKALDWSDPEGVHDMRVASRRLRSALRDFRDLLPKRKVARLSAEVKVIADVLGAVRDQDVALLALDKLRESAPDKLAGSLDDLIGERTSRRDLARKKLTATITSARLAKVQRHFTAVLTQNEPSAEGTPTQPIPPARTTLREFGRGQIKTQLNRFDKKSVALYDPLAAAALHELRIEAKRLRYALELFDVCWGKKVEAFAARIAEMQGALGELHDCDVWIADLGHRLARKKAGATNEVAGSRAGMLWLLDYFAKERTKNYRHALSLWRDWSSTDFSTRLVTILDEKDISTGRKPS